MRPTEAVQIAKSYLIENFASEGISHVTLEEIVFDEDRDVWKITLGFLRKADFTAPFPEFLRPHQVQDGSIKIIYKVVDVRDRDGEVSAVTLRTLAA